MRNYETFGPFVVPRKDGAAKRVLDRSNDAINQFWKDVEGKHPGLSTARGCFLFGIRAGKGIKPWYIGQSTTGFKNECFQSHKLNHYRDVIDQTGKGTPVLSFVARCTNNLNFATSLPVREADFVEHYLIGLALWDNPNLKNVKNTSFYKTVRLPGVLNSPKGQPSAGARLLQRTLGV